MFTVIETQSFKQKADMIWQEDERLAFITELVQNPLAGDVIPNAQGLRKIRWKASGRGKRGGARIIYFNMLDNGAILLLDIYTKNDKENLSQNDLKQLKEVKNAK